MNLDDLNAFVLVARAGGFRDAARSGGTSASGLSEAVSRLETRLGVRLLHRSTRSVVPTEAGERLLQRLSPALAEVAAALESVPQDHGTLKLNVPLSAARLVLPALVSPFLAAYPGIRLEIIIEDGFVDMIAAGCDAGIRYEEKLEQDMIAIPIGPRTQRFAAAASPAYLARRGTPAHPRDLLDHACLRHRFSSGHMYDWEFERNGEIIRLDPKGPLVVQAGADLPIEAAIGGSGVVMLFEDWLRPHFDTGALTPVLEDWWQQFSGPYLYFSGRRLLPAPLRAFVDFVKSRTDS